MSVQAGLAQKQGLAVQWEALAPMAACPLCGSGQRRRTAVRTDGLAVMECGSCTLGYLDPRPSRGAIDAYYDDGYFTGQKTYHAGGDYCEIANEALERGTVTGYRELTSVVDVRGLNVLDIGCASGALLAALKAKGAADMAGVEPCDRPAEYGRRNYGLDVRTGTLETVNLPAERFDLAVMMDVLEHIYDLDVFIAELRRVLKPGGRVFLLTPNYGGLKLAGEGWMCLARDFEHLLYFGSKSLGYACAAWGFELSRWWTEGVPVRMASYGKTLGNGMHRLVSPGVALSNGAWKLRYRLSHLLDATVGYNLYALLRDVG